MAKEGLTLVIQRNLFYRDKYRQVQFGVVVLLLVNALLAGGIVYHWLNPAPPQYFASTADGKIIPLSSLARPVVSDDFVLQWAANQVRMAFAQDYVHWRDQLQRVSGAFTPSGWRYFLSSMKKSNNLKTLIALKMVSSATITGAPQIMEKAVVDGHYAWKIQMPILVSYTNAKRTIPMPMDVTVIVLRMPVKTYPFHIAINNFLPVINRRGINQQVSQGGL